MAETAAPQRSLVCLLLRLHAVHGAAGKVSSKRHVTMWYARVRHRHGGRLRQQRRAGGSASGPSCRHWHRRLQQQRRPRRRQQRRRPGGCGLRPAAALLCAVVCCKNVLVGTSACAKCSEVCSGSVQKGRPVLRAQVWQSLCTGRSGVARNSRLLEPVLICTADTQVARRTRRGMRCRSRAWRTYPRTTMTTLLTTLSLLP